MATQTRSTRKPLFRVPWRSLAPGRRAGRVFGWIAAGGAVLFAVGLAIGLVLEALGAEAASPAALVPVLGGLLLVLGFWPLWGVWSATLDRATPGPRGRLSTRTRVELAATVSTAAGALLLVAGGLPFAILDDGPDGLAVAALACLLVGAAILALTLAFGAVAGGIVLGGRAWWWVGVVFTAGFALLVAELATGTAWWPGALLALVGGCGYVLAMRSGLRRRRPGAVETLAGMRRAAQD